MITLTIIYYLVIYETPSHLDYLHYTFLLYSSSCLPSLYLPAVFIILSNFSLPSCYIHYLVYLLYIFLPSLYLPPIITISSTFTIPSRYIYHFVYLHYTFPLYASSCLPSLYLPDIHIYHSCCSSFITVPFLTVTWHCTLSESIPFTSLLSPKYHAKVANIINLHDGM